MTDDLTWVAEGFDNLMEQCLILVEFDVELWVIGDDGEAGPPPGVTDLICDNDCSENGICVTGMTILLKNCL